MAMDTLTEQEIWAFCKRNDKHGKRDELALKLNEQGFRTATGKKWTFGSVSRFISKMKNKEKPMSDKPLNSLERLHMATDKKMEMAFIENAARVMFMPLPLTVRKQMVVALLKDPKFIDLEPTP